MKNLQTQPVAIVCHDGGGAWLRPQLNAAGFYVDGARLGYVDYAKFTRADLVVVAAERTNRRLANAVFRQCCAAGVASLAVGAAFELVIDFFGRNEFVVTAASDSGELLALSHVFRPFRAVRDVTLGVCLELAA